MKYLMLGLCLIGALYANNKDQSLDYVKVDISAYEDINHAR